MTSAAVARAYASLPKGHVQCIVFPKGMHRSMSNVDKGLRAVGMLHKVDKMNPRPRAEPNDLVEAM